MSILVVDDSKLVRTQLEKLLRGGGYDELFFAESVREALKILIERSAEGRRNPVDLILLDIEMPEMDGLKGCRLIKANKNLAGIPIIMVTSRTGVEDLRAAFAAGAIDYITKPVNDVELLARIGSQLRLKEEMDRRQERERELSEANRMLQEVNQKLERLTIQDGLTGIPNRRYFDEYLYKVWGWAVRQGESLAVMLLDIDFFKLYNDTYGHLAGDDCLRMVAGGIAGNMRRSSDAAARYGGEEFGVILPGADLPSARIVGENILKKINDLKIEHRSSRVSDRVSISIGIAAVVPDRDQTMQSLVDAADKALYQAKESGRNRIFPSSTDNIPE